jgi:hypothetical protein
VAEISGVRICCDAVVVKLAGVMRKRENEKILLRRRLGFLWRRFGISLQDAG